MWKRTLPKLFGIKIVVLYKKQNTKTPQRPLGKTFAFSFNTPPAGIQLDWR